VEIVVMESVNCTITRDGDFQSCEVLGELILKCLDPKKLKLTVQLQLPPECAGLKPHPNLKKDVFTQAGVLEAKSAFPLSQSLSALKYRNVLQAPFGLCTWYNHPSLTVELSKSVGGIPLEALKLVLPDCCEVLSEEGN